MGLFSREPGAIKEVDTAEKPIETYKVIYKGGHPDYPKAKTAALMFNMYSDRFEILPTIATKWFVPMTMPFNIVTDLKIVERQVGTAEAILGGLNSRQLNQANNININFAYNNQPITLRLEMLTGVTVTGQAKKCQEFEDRLTTNGIRQKFVAAPTLSSAQPAQASVADEILKYSNLHKQGVITAEEFQAKKKQLLGL